MRRVFVLGNATLDCVQRIRRFPNPGETLLCDSLQRCAGGKGLNQALASVRTGAPTVLAAAIGRDAEGAVVAATLESEPGLETRWIASQAPTDYSSIWVNADGENAIVSSAAAAQSLSEAAALTALADFGPGDLLVLQGNLAQGVTEAAATLARDRGGFSVLNTAPIAWDMSRVVGMVDLVVANRVEAAQLASGDPATAAEMLASGGNCMTVVTLGRGGRDPGIERRDLPDLSSGGRGGRLFRSRRRPGGNAGRLPRQGPAAARGAGGSGGGGFDFGDAGRNGPVVPVPGGDRGIDRALGRSAARPLVGCAMEVDLQAQDTAEQRGQIFAPLGPEMPSRLVDLLLQPERLRGERILGVEIDPAAEHPVADRSAGGAPAPVPVHPTLRRTSR